MRRPLAVRATVFPALAVLLGVATAPALAADHGKSGEHGKKGTHHESPRQQPSHSAHQKPSSSSHPAQPQGQGGSGDPAGNNGTMKVDGVPFDDGHDNEPHVTCEFRLVFWGFDAGQTGSIEIDGHAPSGSGVVNRKDGVLISDDAAGGGNDMDATVTYGAADLDLSGLTAQPKQGYHLKVTLTTDAGVKHKVFWYQPCTAPETTPTVGGTTEQVPPTETTAPVQARVLGVKLTRPNVTREQPSSRTAVLGTRMTRAGGLPFTGAAFIAGLIAIATGLLTAGGAVMVFAYRHRIT